MQAIRLALDEEMARDEKVIMMGQDIGILGGAYGVTGDLYHKYGPDRVIDAPLSENAIVGFGIGAAIRGWRPIIDIMKMDFSMCALDPIVNHLAKYRYMSGGQISCMPAVVRTVIGGGTRSGPHHSQSVYSLYAGFPGLKVGLRHDSGGCKGAAQGGAARRRSRILLRGSRGLPNEGRSAAGSRLCRSHRKEQSGM